MDAQSESGQRLHFVKPAKKVGGFLCDDQCLAYNAQRYVHIQWQWH